MVLSATANERGSGMLEAAVSGLLVIWFDYAWFAVRRADDTSTSSGCWFHAGGVGYKLLSHCTQSVVIMHHAGKHIQLVCTINRSEGENITEK